MARIKIADKAGACYGVERALELAWTAVSGTSDDVFTLGPLIHNPRVVSSLDAMGAHEASAVDEAAGATIILRTHGVTPQEEERARAICAHVIDATCPFVKKVHVAVEKLMEEGYQVLVVGESGHPEVEATLAHAPGALAVCSAEEARALDLGPRVGIVVQTTQSLATLESVLKAIDDGAREVKLVNTICEATSSRQEAAAQLASEVGAMVVIGGRNSANTTRLAEICRSICGRTFHIEQPEELQRSWFEGVESIGITAGASTPSSQIASVVSTLEALTRRECR
ncbi:4-hydroxy-3-methylbut-2-enyl diphosphate reductase [Coriobacteriales bacterium OH1046]|nr:4-hydroxy-3-methylbut-2-enyl diphosphate reductase [Coriobacteriales bacterium OH1046]